MSAFLVENETINRIVAYVGGDHYLRQEFEPLGYDLREEESRRVLGMAMYELNVEALRVRYHGGDPVRAYEYAFVACDDAVLVLKNLTCWLYQCCEGSLPETSSLYKIMNGLKGQIAYAIVCNSPEYDRAKGWA